MTKDEQTRNMRYKRTAMKSLGWEQISAELDDISEACGEVHWFFDGQNGENLIAALDDNEEEAFEFKMAFADLEGKCYQLQEQLYDWHNPVGEYFDDCIVSLIGRRYSLVGFDDVEEDYFSIASYQAELATTEAGKRVMRWTKADMLSKIGQCLGIVIAFLDIRQSYDYLKATMDILRDENTSLLQIIKDIEAAYEKALEWDSPKEDINAFERLLDNLPERCWVE